MTQNKKYNNGGRTFTACRSMCRQKEFRAEIIGKIEIEGRADRTNLETLAYPDAGDELLELSSLVERGWKAKFN